MSFPMCRRGNKCRRLHGHSFRIEIHVEGTLEATRGWIMDFGEIKNAFQPIYDQLDHRYLNEVEGLSNPPANTSPDGSGNVSNHRSPGCRKSSCAKPAPAAASIGANDGHTVVLKQRAIRERAVTICDSCRETARPALW